MQTNKIYRSRALEVLRGNWKPYVLASLILMLTVLVIYIPFVLLADKHPALMLSLLYPLMFCVYMPLAYAFGVGLVDKYRGLDAPFTGHMLSVFKSEYGRGLKSFLLIMLYAMLMVIGICIVAAIAAVGIGAATGDLKAFMGDVAAGESPFMLVYIGLVYLFMIPFMIWAYAVMLTPYLAHDRKDLKIRECLSLSIKMMKGHKWQLFCLQLSFIGWALLTVLTAFIGTLWLAPYQEMAQAAFYDDVLRESTPAADNIEAAVEAMADDASAE